MKKLSLSLMLNVSLALMLALSLIYPQSVAVNFVAAWAILATVICVVASGVGVYATEYVLERYGRELPPESLERDSFGRSVRCTSRYRNSSRLLVRFMLPSRT